MRAPLLLSFSPLFFLFPRLGVLFHFAMSHVHRSPRAAAKTRKFKTWLPTPLPRTPSPLQRFARTLNPSIPPTPPSGHSNQTLTIHPWLYTHASPAGWRRCQNDSPIVSRCPSGPHHRIADCPRTIPLPPASTDRLRWPLHVSTTWPYDPNRDELSKAMVALRSIESTEAVIIDTASLNPAEHL